VDKDSPKRALSLCLGAFLCPKPAGKIPDKRDDTAKDPYSDFINRLCPNVAKRLEFQVRHSEVAIGNPFFSDSYADLRYPLLKAPTSGFAIITTFYEPARVKTAHLRYIEVRPERL
jgi:hypothetical protein